MVTVQPTSNPNNLGVLLGTIRQLPMESKRDLLLFLEEELHEETMRGKTINRQLRKRPTTFSSQVEELAGIFSHVEIADDYKESISDYLIDKYGA